MRLLRLQLALCAVSAVAVTASNRLLEDYERKLNSVNDKLVWRRNPGKHRLKRYRCIEEYVDEYGNVIEEGKEHLTTPAPIREFTMQRRKMKTRMHGVKNTMITTTPTNPMKGLKVTMVKKKRKKLDDGGEVFSTTAGLKTKLKKIYPYVTTVPLTTTTTTVIPTTELIEDDDSADATIMKNYFKPAQPSPQDDMRIDNRDRSYNNIRRAPQFAALPPLDSSEVADSVVDEDISDGVGRRFMGRRQRKLGGSTKYIRDRLDYDTNYDDYSYLDDEPPVVRRRMGRRKFRQFMGYPVVRFRRRGFRNVPPHLFQYDELPRATETHPAVIVSATPSEVRQKLLSIAVSLPHGKLPQPQSTPLPPIPQQPPPLPLVAPPTQANPPVIPLGVPLAQQPLPIPLTPAPPSQMIQMEESTPETCQRMRRLATSFGINDISSYARRNCRFLQAFAPGYTCEQITHFVDSCNKNNL